MASKVIDDYYVAESEGISRKKPVVKSTKWWTDIRQAIERRLPKNWSEAAVMLLNVTHEDQLDLEKRFRTLKKKVKKHWRNPQCENAVGLLPSKGRRDAFVLAAYREAQKNRHRLMIRNILDEVFSRGQATRCLIIGINVNRSDYPYSFLAVQNRRDVGPHPSGYP